MGTELVPETLYSNELTRLCAWENYIESCRRESFKTYIERRAYKNMATENSLYYANMYYSKQIILKFKTALSSPCSIYSNAESSNTYYMWYSHKVFGNTVNKKCSVSENLPLLWTS
jgi:hypothetical protein